jgi:hypothetical protein
MNTTCHGEIFVLPVYRNCVLILPSQYKLLPNDIIQRTSVLFHMSYVPEDNIIETN